MKTISSSIEDHLNILKLSGVHDLMMTPRAPHSLAADLPEISPEITLPRQDRRDCLIDMMRTVQSCEKCPELAKSRTRTVFGAGNINAKLVFVGEAPGFDEDQQGLPFVGKAGQLLTKMIEAIGLKRSDVFICNVLKCRPPQNRNPNPDEVTNCSPYLWSQLETINPQVICTLGNFAARTILKMDKAISQLRGSVHTVREWKVVCTFHPSYLLRSPEEKRKAWDDLKRVQSLLNTSA